VFENGNIGTLARRVPPDQVLSAVPLGLGDPKMPREPKTPRGVELLRKVIEWQGLLESGKIASQADIARQEGITRGRVTQIMGMLRLAPEIQEQILSMPDVALRPLNSERILRPIATIAFASFRFSWSRHPTDSHPRVSPVLQIADGDGRGGSLRHHEGDGHTNIKTTMIYVSLRKSHIRDQVEKLNTIHLRQLPTRRKALPAPTCAN